MFARRLLVLGDSVTCGAVMEPQWTDEALELFGRYRWPGNVRELANIVERLAILHAGQQVTATHVREVLPVDRDGSHHTPPGAGPAVGGGLRAALPSAEQLNVSLTETLDEYERVLITRALSVAGGNVAEAARRLQTDRPNLYRRMRRLGISGVGPSGAGVGGMGGGAASAID